MATKEELLARLSECVLEMEDDAVTEIAQEYADVGHDPVDGILHGLVDGINKAAQLYEEEEYFIPELLICSQAMYNGLDVLKPLIPQEASSAQRRIVIGVVEGDTHDIGKNLVKIMLESAGFEMIDLGRDVPIEKFVEAVRDQNADAVVLSTLMSTTMPNMARIIESLGEAGLRDRVKVAVGGAPVSPAFAKKIGADGYSRNATEAVQLLKQLVGV